MEFTQVWYTHETLGANPMSLQDAGTVDVAAGAQLAELFPIPVLTYEWPDPAQLNADLQQTIMGRMERSPGVVKTNRGGWQSNTDLQTWTDPPVRVLLQRIQTLMRELVRRTVRNVQAAHLQDWEVLGWANVNQKGHFNRAHHHIGARSQWSGIYYVQVGDLRPNAGVTGRTVFEDRSMVPKETINNPDPFERQVTVMPKNGLMVIFPASLYHSVEPYSGEGVRITIAFNLWNPAFTVPFYPGMESRGWMWTNFRGLMLIPTKAPEKARALASIPKYLLARRPPASLRPAEWRHYLRTAVDHAFANASERAQAKQISRS
jgi:uncharacterized protein (TIGR02466 family)